jgi:hypothetical protein
MMSLRSCSEVLRHVSNAWVATSGSCSSSCAEMPLRVRIGSLVVGEMVVIASTDMLCGRSGEFMCFRFQIILKFLELPV